MLSVLREPAPLFPPAACTLRACAPSDFEPLVAAAVLERMARCAAQFPVSAQTVCFESRLASDDDRIDLAFAIFPEPDL
jgi:hypothetical protein